MNDPNILLVDDVDFFLEMEKEYLKHTPARVMTARNGREALGAAAKVKPDLVFMDVVMPVMDGLTCCKIFKKDPGLKTVPIIMVFAPSKEVDLAACEAAGCDGVLTKPIDRKSFLDLGHRFLFQVDRREIRVPCQMTVDFSIAGEKMQGMGVDLSEHGLYVNFRQPVVANQKVNVSFYLPTVTSQRLEVKGRVAWVNQGFPRPHMRYPQGFGVEFLNINQEVGTFIRQFVERQSPGSDL